MLEWALRYIRLGWPVIPLRGKIPLTENGSKDASLNESQVRAWWARWPDANIGLATGHGWFAIDIDTKAGGDETWDTLRMQHGALPNTPEQTTGTGGRHILYKTPADFVVKNSQGKLGPGIDVRGLGGYIVAAPSIHPDTGRRYEWDGLAEIEDTAIADAPAWLIRLLRESERRPGGEAPPVQVPDKIREGGRNDTLFRIASRFRRNGLSEEEILAALREMNRKRCEPPLDDAELQTIAHSAARYKPDGRANLFGQRSPQQVAPRSGGELPLTTTDILAAIDGLIESNSITGVFDEGLIGHIAKMRANEIGLIKAKLREHFGADFSYRDFDKALRDRGRGAVLVMPEPPQPGDPNEPDLLLYRRSDSGNAERMIALYGENLRYCVEMEKWLIWDGKRWAIDDRNWASQLAKQTARRLDYQVRRRPDLGGEDREAWIKFALRSENHRAITDALKRAASEPDVAIKAEELDQNIYLLNCNNGMVELRTGKLLPHDRAVMITKLCPVDYEPQAKCDQFQAFLHWAMGDNPDAEMTRRTMRLCSFLQRAFGYSLTADVSEKAAFVFWGEKGNNGKTTLLTTFKTILDEYATEISIDTLMSTKVQDATLRADLADLRGARFVTTSEVEKEHRLSEGKLKYITAGMGSIKSCRKYENPIAFKATHKLFMDCNHRPQVRGVDDAIWQRLKLIPFEVSISDAERDKKLIDKLIAESAGILAWAVRGCRGWFESGLGDVEEIVDAGRAWREHDDPLKEFFEDCCDIDPGSWVRSSELRVTYDWWCKRNRENFPLNRTAFTERVHAKGFKTSRSRRNTADKQMRTIEGVRVKEEIAKQVLADGGRFHTMAD